jgi:hypothetical protein
MQLIACLLLLLLLLLLFSAHQQLLSYLLLATEDVLNSVDEAHLDIGSAACTNGSRHHM